MANPRTKTFSCGMLRANTDIAKSESKNMNITGPARANAKVNITDSQSGYRAFRTEVLKNVHAVGDRYDYEQDFLFRAARQGYRFADVPISTVYGAPSHFRAAVDAWRIIRVLWRHKAGIFR